MMFPKLMIAFIVSLWIQGIALHAASPTQDSTLPPNSWTNSDAWTYNCGDEFSADSLNARLWNCSFKPALASARILFSQDALNIVYPYKKTDSERTTELRSQFTMLYGRLEINAQMPQKGEYTVKFYLNGVNRNQSCWPKCGEILIVQRSSSEKTQLQGVYYEDAAGQFQSSTLPIECSKKEFNVYSVERDSETIKIFVNNQLASIFKVRDANCGPYNSFRQPHQLYIQLTSHNGTPITGFQIESVRFYTPKK